MNGRKPTLAMPHGGGQKLDVPGLDYDMLADWIASGAPAPRPDDERIQRLEVFPTESVLKPKDTLNVLVRAWYSDGHAEDVTRWARFASSEDLVALVDANGRLVYKKEFDNVMEGVNYLQIGDPVTYTNTGGSTVTPVWDGYGDWNVPWATWQAGGVLPS